MKNLIRKRRMLFVLSLLVLGIAFHPFLLRTATMGVIRPDEPYDAATYLLVLRSARTSKSAFEYAANFCNGDPDQRVLVMRDYVRRAESIGAASPFVEDTIAMLVERGVPRSQIEVIGDGKVMTTSEQLRFAAGWLEQQPSSVHLQVATKRFNTGFVVAAAERVIPGSMRTRVHILGFDRGGVSRANWWHDARGVKEFIRASLRLVHLKIFGDNRPDVDWDPDEYEKSLLASKHD